jgi:molecular chaperone Hsp33
MSGCVCLSGSWYRNGVSAEKPSPENDERAASDRGRAGTSDFIVRGLIEAGRARVVVATATAAVREMTQRHEIVGLPAVALGRTAVAGLLLATLTKDEEQVTLQILGDGPLGGVTVDARSSGRVRGFVKRPSALPWDPALAQTPRLAIGAAIGRQGVVGVIRDLGLAQNYSGQVTLASGEIDEEVERYLTTSEQIDSLLRCDALVDSAGRIVAVAGLLVQTLPQAHGAALVEFLRSTLAGPVFAGVLRDALARGGLAPEAIACAALGPSAVGMQVLDRREVRFFCPCTRQRAEATLGMLRPADLQEMILETNEAEVTCNFCGVRYRFSEAELEDIRRRHGTQRAQS